MPVKPILKQPLPLWCTVDLAQEAASKWARPPSSPCQSVLIITPDTALNEHPMAFEAEKEIGRLAILRLIRAAQVSCNPERNHTYWIPVLQS